MSTIFLLCFQGLNVVDLEDLIEDIHVYCTIEKDTNLEFWKVLHFVNNVHVVTVCRGVRQIIVVQYLCVYMRAYEFTVVYA